MGGRSANHPTAAGETRLADTGLGAKLQLLQWFNPQPDAQTLPLLPQVHDGHYDVLRMVKFEQQGPRFIRLWRTNIRIQQGETEVPLWLGSVGKLYRQQVMGLTLFRTAPNYHSALILFRNELTGVHPPFDINTVSSQLNGQAIQILLLQQR